jgi:CheY-like chemotaxis protein
MQITKIALTTVVVIILFEVLPEKSVWSIPVRQADEHSVAVPSTGGFSLLLMHREADKTLTKEQQRFWKRILIVDDNADIIKTFKFGIENATSKRIVVDAYNDPRKALLDFQPNFYDLLLVDINMSYMNGFQLSEKILDIDINIKICFMTSGEINRDALREIYPSISLGCFISKPVTIDCLVERIIKELD